ncbi:MAG: hypothetical protein JWN07_68 [Hyphomicrobiales bacterium]|nr:hypothetical protein [Hyphomicrobiales bacterium]
MRHLQDSSISDLSDLHSNDEAQAQPFRVTAVIHSR